MKRLYDLARRIANYFHFLLKLISIKYRLNTARLRREESSNSNRDIFGIEGGHVAMVKNNNPSGIKEETEPLSDLQFFQSLDKVNCVMHGTNDLERMMSDVLDIVLSIFKCDRAFLLYECDPLAPLWFLRMERTHPKYPGVLQPKTPLPMTASIKRLYEALLGTDGTVELNPGKEFNLEETPWKTCKLKSMLSIALYPKVGKPWAFGLQQSSRNRIWKDKEKKLFQEIGRRLADALTSLLMYRDLQHSEKFLNTIIEHIPSLIFVKDAKDLRFVRFNKSGDKLRGSVYELLIGKNDYDIFPKNEADHFTTKDREALNTNQIIDIPEEMIRTGINEKRLFHTQKIPILDETGKPKYLLGISEDITQRKQVEEALRESEERYRTIIEQMEDGYFEVDFAGNFTFVNDAEGKILGYSVDELIGMNYRQYLDETSAQKADQLFHKVYSIGEPIKALDVVIIMKNGTIGFHELSASLVRDTKGKPIGFRGLCRDVTERKQAEEEKRRLEERLNRAEKMEVLGQLAGGVAHDLNNVLGVLTGYSELLLMEIPKGQRARSHVEKILQSTEKGAAIIQDLLTLARRGVTASDVINLNNIVSAFLKTPVFENIKDYHPRVTFRTECDKNLLNIKGSPVHLEKTLMNLVANAAESITGEGDVTIKTESRYLDKAIVGYDEVREGDYAILSVSDTGMGISAENKDKIFDPFYTKKMMGRSGTGLGLSIVWGTVKDLNGYIDVQTKIGEGTIFTLYFPVTREELITSQHKTPIEQYTGNGESVLVIDDIAEQRDVASKLLTRLGYRVHAVSCGEAAVEYLKDNKADILVLDMIMVPGIDGLETYKRVLEVNPRQKAILVSGFSETDRVREAHKLGAGAYVKKPYVMETIGLAIRDELNR